MHEVASGTTQQATTLANWLLTGTSISALVGGAFAFYRYMMERRKDRAQRLDELEQRRIELRWRQAQAAKQLLDEMLDDAQAAAALEMLDSWSREFEIGLGRREVISAERWLAALRSAPDTADAPLDMFVRDGFDSLFYFMAMLDHYITRDFIRFEDIAFPFNYYVNIMAEDKAIHAGYLAHYGLREVTPFLERFPQWNAGSVGTA